MNRTNRNEESSLVGNPAPISAMSANSRYGTPGVLFCLSPGTHSFSIVTSARVGLGTGNAFKFRGPGIRCAGPGEPATDPHSGTRDSLPTFGHYAASARASAQAPPARRLTRPRRSRRVNASVPAGASVSGPISRISHRDSPDYDSISRSTVRQAEILAVDFRRRISARS